MKRLTFFAICISLSSLPSHAGADEEVFSDIQVVLKENQVTKLRGIINVVYLPLPDDLELGKSQSGYFLFTANPCDVSLGGEGNGGEVVKNQQMFHLVLSEEQMAGIKKFLQKPVEITASPFGSHTRHHRTPVLLEVKSIRLLSTD